MAIDWQTLWSELNERQQAYLAILYQAEDSKADYYLSLRGSSDPLRKGGEWRWCAYHSTTTESGMDHEIEELGIRDPGTGSSWDALAERGYVERRWEWTEQRNLRGQVRDFHLLSVKLTTRGRKLCRENFGPELIAMLSRLRKDAAAKAEPITPKQKRSAAREAEAAAAKEQGLTVIAMGYDVWVPESCIEPLTKIAQERAAWCTANARLLRHDIFPSNPEYAEAQALKQQEWAAADRIVAEVKELIEAAGCRVTDSALYTLRWGIGHGWLGLNPRNWSSVLQLLPLRRGGKRVRTELRRVYGKEEENRQ